MTESQHTPFQMHTYFRNDALVLRNCGRGECCLILLISRFNEQCIDGFTYLPQSGRPRKLTATDIVTEILPVVDDPTPAGQLHRTAVKLCSRLRL